MGSKGKAPDVISDVVLAYIAHSLQNSAANHIKIVCAQHFSVDEIVQARDTLMVKGDEKHVKLTKRKNITSKRGLELTTSDIVDAVKTLCDEDCKLNLVVHFEQLGRLPHSMPNETCPISICDRLAKLEAKMHETEEVATVGHCKVLALEDEVRRMQGPSYAVVSRPRPDPKPSEAPERLLPREQREPRPERSSGASVHPGLSDARERNDPQTLAKQLLTRSRMKPASSEQSLASSRPSLYDEGFDYDAEQKRRRRRQRIIKGQKSGGGGSLVGAPEPLRDIFVYRLRKSTKADDVAQHMIDNEMEPQTIELVSHEDSRFSSFRVQVNASLLQKVLQPDMWPENVCVRRYWQKKKKEDKSPPDHRD